LGNQDNPPADAGTGLTEEPPSFVQKVGILATDWASDQNHHSPPLQGRSNAVKRLRFGQVSGVLASDSGARMALASLILARVFYATNWLNVGAIYKLMSATLGGGVVGLGTLTSSFYLGVGLVQVPAGVLAAKLGPKKVVVWGILISSSATMGLAVCTTVWEAAAFRFVVGSGMAMVFAPAVVLVARFVGQGRAGAGVGIFNSAYNIGGLIGLYGWVVIATMEGWQTGLLLSGGIGLATCAGVLRFVPGSDAGDPGPVTRPLLRIIGDPQLILLGLGTLGITVANVLIANFMVYYLNSTLAVPLDTSGLVASLLVVLPIASSVFGGRLYDRTRRPRLIMLATALGLVLSLVLPSYPSVLAAALGAAIGGVASGIGFTTAFAWSRDLNPLGREYDGLAIAWVNGISLTGAFIPPIVFSYFVGEAGYSAAWLAGAGMCLAFSLPMVFQKEKGD
jgi:MFS family permease